MKIRKGDKIKVLSGKDSTKTGVVERVFTKTGKVTVSGINIAKKHTKAQRGIKGGIIDKIMPMDASNLMVICSKCQKPARVGFKVVDSKKYRVCKKCKEVFT